MNVRVVLPGPPGPPGAPGQTWSVIDRDLSAPPVSPAIGDTYIVGAAPTGAWAGHVNHVAIWSGVGWLFTVPKSGAHAWMQDEPAPSIYFDGSAWAPAVFQILAARYPIRSISKAAGDGVTDDRSALIAARNLGKPLSGEGRTYAVNGQFSLISDLDIANARLKQLAHAASNEVRTIYGENVDRTRLNDIIVDRNGDGTVGTIAGGGAAGAYLTGGRDHHWGRVEVFGSDKGTGIYLLFLHDSDFDDLFVHDMFNEDTTTLDDQLQGVSFSNVRNCRLRARVRNLFSKATTLSSGAAIGTGTYYGAIATGTAIVSATSTSVVMASDASAVDDAYNAMQMVVIAGTGAGYANTIIDYVGSTRTASFVIPWPVTLDATSRVAVRSSIYSRGFAGGSCRDCQLISLAVQFVDQGCDITSGGGHPGLQVLDGEVRDCATWGFKFANAQQYLNLGNLSAIRCGHSGFVFQGDLTHDIDCFGTVAYDTGYGTIWPLTATTGYHIANVSAPTFPKGIRLDGARAISSIGNMAYGAWSNVPTIDPLSPNERFGFRSIGHTIAPTFGNWEEDIPLSNMLINGDFAIDQRLVTAPADGAYVHDRWHVLTQSNPLTVGSLSNAENQQAKSIRLTQSNAGAQRMGLAQIVESVTCQQMRAKAITLSGRVRFSSSATIRYAIYEWTGTADAVTKDVVNDWTSSTYTGGNFFVASTFNILAVGSIALTANTWADIPDLVATVGTSANNLGVFLWTEATAAQNVTLDFGLLQLQQGRRATPFVKRSFAEQFEQCLRFYEKSFQLANAPVNNVGSAGGAAAFAAITAAATTNRSSQVSFKARKRGNPTITTYNPSAANADMRDTTAAADCTATNVGNSSQSGFTISATGPAGGAVGDLWAVHWTAESEIGV